jgi:hypothetical protein
MNDSIGVSATELNGFPVNGSGAEKLAFLVQYAAMAPSKYNVQPWLFDVCNVSADLICERHGALRVADPESRELIMSCGAALFNFRVAAARYGCGVVIEPFPERGNHHLTARISLASPVAGAACSGSPPPERPGDAEKSGIVNGRSSPSTRQLFEAIPLRRTCRRRFSEEVPPDRVLASFRKAAAAEGAWLHTIRNRWTQRMIARLVAKADREQMSNRLFRRELAAWIRGAHSPDGLPASAFGVQGLPPFMAPGLSGLLKLADLGGLTAARNRRLAESSPVLAVLGSADDTPEAWLAAGQALQSVLLHAAAAGLSASFLNQPVQVRQLRADLLYLVGRTGHPQALIRLGYGTSINPTPRRPLREIVVNPFERNSKMILPKIGTPLLNRAPKGTGRPARAGASILSAQGPVGTSRHQTIIHRTFPGAKAVFIAGSFNGWAATDNPMENSGGDRWRVELKLAPGRHEYLVLVDGKWTDDPVVHGRVPNPYGGFNSVLVISEATANKSDTVKLPMVMR